MISNAEDGPANLKTRPSGRMGRSYARRHGDYLYDIEIHEAVPAGQAGRFCATVVNVVRLAPGPPVSVTPVQLDSKRETLPHNTAATP